MVVEMCGGVDTAFALTVQSVSTEIELRIVLRDGRGQASSHIELVRSQKPRGREVSSQLLLLVSLAPSRIWACGRAAGNEKMLAVEVTQGFL